MNGLLGSHQVAWNGAAGRISFTPGFSGYSSGAVEQFSFTVYGFSATQPIQLTVRMGKDVLETQTFSMNVPACDRTQPISPLPTATETPIILPTPSLSETFPIREGLILGDEIFAVQLSDSEKEARWQQGLPAPMPTIEDESNLPREFTPWEGGTAANEAQQNIQAASATPVSATSVAIVDGWTQRSDEGFEQETPPAGGCVWRTGRNTQKTNYQWGRANRRAANGSYSTWPAGSAATGAYPDNLENWWQCEYSQPQTTHDILVDFQLWLELDNGGDRFEVRFYPVACTAANASNYRGGIWWQGTAQGVANSDNQFKNFQVFYPGLQSTGGNKLCIEFKFSSDTLDGAKPDAQGPWLDDVRVSDYQKPTTSSGCQNTDPTVAVLGAPGSGAVSKGIVLPSYADDFAAGVVDNPANQLDIAGMVERLQEAGVHWVRLEFIIPPGNLMRGSTALAPHGVSHIDLRHYDRVIDMLCANNMGVLGLIDYQTLERRDWNTNIIKYTEEFTTTTRQIVGYFNDRIRYWEVWNEPNFEPTGITENSYARLLSATHDAIKAVDMGDQVLFAGLAQAGQNSENYFATVSTALGDRKNPAPYDIFALHPYPSDEYTRSGKVVVDPLDYLHWPEQPPKPTIIHKFFDTMGENGKTNKPIWMTEMGWNRAADSTNPATLTCPLINSTMVSGVDQALYVVRGMDTLFKETAWDSGTPSVNKIFWYQYVDVGIPQSMCNSASSAGNSPSWYSSFIVRGGAAAQEAQVDWWFGLYSGIDWAQNGKISPNLVQCTYQAYPIDSPGEILECLGLVYLPLIQRDAVTTGQ